MSRVRAMLPLLAGMLALAGGTRADPAASVCVDVRIAGDLAFSCLNAELKQMATQAHRASSLDTPIRADRLPAPAAGVFDQAATAETLGSAFGTSVVAQRPASDPYGVHGPAPGTSAHR